MRSFVSTSPGAGGSRAASPGAAVPLYGPVRARQGLRCHVPPVNRGCSGRLHLHELQVPECTAAGVMTPDAALSLGHSYPDVGPFPSPEGKDGGAAAARAGTRRALSAAICLRAAALGSRARPGALGRAAVKPGGRYGVGVEPEFKPTADRPSRRWQRRPRGAGAVWGAAVPGGEPGAGALGRYLPGEGRRGPAAPARPGNPEPGVVVPRARRALHWAR